MSVCNRRWVVRHHRRVNAQVTSRQKIPRNPHSAHITSRWSGFPPPTLTNIVGRKNMQAFFIDKFHFWSEYISMKKACMFLRPTMLVSVGGGNPDHRLVM